MSKNEFFKKYQSYVSELISLTSAEDDSQSGIAQEERNKVAQTENAYLQTMSELRKARQIVDEQIEASEKVVVPIWDCEDQRLNDHLIQMKGGKSA